MRFYVGTKHVKVGVGHHRPRSGRAGLGTIVAGGILIGAFAGWLVATVLGYGAGQVVADVVALSVIGAMVIQRVRTRQ